MTNHRLHLRSHPFGHEPFHEFIFQADERLRTADKTDAAELVSRLDRYLAGNRKAFAVVRVPTPEEEQRRCVSRQREQLRRERQRLNAMGKSLMLAQFYRTVLATVQEQLDVGCGPLTLATAQNEVGNWSRFSNRRQVGSLSGLCGGVSSSGQSHVDLCITKHGNARLRYLLIELAWRMVKFQPQCKTVQKWKHILLQPALTVTARLRREDVSKTDRWRSVRELWEVWEAHPHLLDLRFFAWFPRAGGTGLTRAT